METLACNLWTEAISKADAWINMHANVRSDSLLFSIVNRGDPRNKEQNTKMAEAFGYTNIYFDQPPAAITGGVVPPNTTSILAGKKGIPYLMVEFIEGRWISEPSTSMGIRGTLNVMKLFNMIDGKIERHPEKFPIISGVNRSIGLIRPRRGGLVRLLKKPGVPIKKGETFAEVYNLHGDLIEEVKMPTNGYVWAYPCGDFCDTAGNLQTVNTGCGLAFAFIHEKD
jgi:predicted deacylase